MDELDRGLDISISGPLREEALAACRAQLDEWRTAMPPVEPLVLDFGLDDFSRVGLIEYWIANEQEAGYCGKYLFVFAGQTCPVHRHHTKMETFFLVKGHARMTHAGEKFDMSPGDVLRVVPGSLHSFTGLGPALLLELSMPCVVADNEFADPRIPIGRREGESPQ